MDQSTQTPAIEVKNLTKRFGGVLAVDNCSFTIPAGVIAGFVGPNGSGKTTTMRILTTLLQQDGGSARVFGHETCLSNSAASVRHSLGFMPDYFGLYTEMTASEYLDFFGAAYRIPVNTRVKLIDDILALVNLTEKRDALIAGLSRGMQQKLSLGRCLIHSPKLLLLDEPASGLDPRARIELMELLREMKNMGKTVFISSHILSELHSLCDMVVIIEKGRMVYTGGIDEASDNVLAGKRFLELETGSDPDQAAEFVKTIAGVIEIRRKERTLFVEHTPALASADIIAACVGQGIRVEAARKGTANLEEIFMHLTDGTHAQE